MVGEEGHKMKKMKTNNHHGFMDLPDKASLSPDYKRRTNDKFNINNMLPPTNNRFGKKKASFHSSGSIRSHILETIRE